MTSPQRWPVGSMFAEFKTSNSSSFFNIIQLIYCRKNFEMFVSKWTRKYLSTEDIQLFESMLASCVVKAGWHHKLEQKQSKTWWTCVKHKGKWYRKGKTCIKTNETKFGLIGTWLNLHSNKEKSQLVAWEMLFCRQYRSSCSSFKVWIDRNMVCCIQTKKNHS